MLKRIAQVAPREPHEVDAEFRACQEMQVIPHFLTHCRGIGHGDFCNGRDGVVQGEANPRRQAGRCASDEAFAGRAFGLAPGADNVDIGALGEYAEEVKSQLARVIPPLIGRRRARV